MIPQIKKENSNLLTHTDLLIERKPVLVYKTDINNIEESNSKKELRSSMATDWSLFMEDLNSEMFQKISF